MPNLFEAKQKRATLEPEERAFTREFAYSNQIDFKPCRWWDTVAQTDPEPHLKEQSNRIESGLAELGLFENTPQINPGSTAQKNPCVSDFQSKQ